MPSLRQIAEKSGEVKVKFKGLEFEVEYYADRVTKEFRAEAMRLNREVQKNKRRAEVLENRVSTITAADDSDEMVLEDAAAEAAIARLLSDEDDLKRQMDTCVASIVRKWDLTDDETLKPVPICAEDSTQKSPKPHKDLFKVPAMFEGEVLSAILNDGQEQGEAPGASSPTPISLSSKQRDKQATSRPLPTSYRSSRRVRR